MRLLIDLYENQGDGFVALKDIAARQDISKKYLEQIVPALTGDGVLKTSRGFQGGYRLAREPEDIPVGEILRLTEGSLAPVACLDSKSNECPRCADCLTLPLWHGLEDLRAVLLGKKAHTPRKKTVTQAEPPKVNLLVDIQAKLQAGKGCGCHGTSQ